MRKDFYSGVVKKNGLFLDSLNQSGCVIKTWRLQELTDKKTIYALTLF